MANPQWEDGYFKLANKIREHLAKIRIPGQAMQVLWVIWGKTYGWNKKKDAISLSQLAEETGMYNSNVVRARDILLKMNLITTIKKGNGSPTTYSFQKDYKEWKALPKKVRGVSKKVIGSIKKGNKPVSKKVHTKDIKTLPKDNGAKKPAPAKSKTNPDVKKVAQHFATEYQKKFGVPYVSNFAKDGTILKRLLKPTGPYDPGQMEKLIAKLFSTDNEFICSTARDIGQLKSQINMLAQWCREDADRLKRIAARQEAQARASPTEKSLTDEQRKENFARGMAIVKETFKDKDMPKDESSKQI